MSPDWQSNTPDFSIGQSVKVAMRPARVVGFVFDNDIRVRFADGREDTFSAYEITPN